jgi:hypothetical protein
MPSPAVGITEALDATAESAPSPALRAAACCCVMRCVIGPNARRSPAATVTLDMTAWRGAGAASESGVPRNQRVAAPTQPTERGATPLVEKSESGGGDGATTPLMPPPHRRPSSCSAPAPVAHTARATTAEVCAREEMGRRHVSACIHGRSSERRAHSGSHVAARRRPSRAVR